MKYNYLVFGGTGTIGTEIVRQLLFTTKEYNVKTIRIFTNSENELWESKELFNDHPKMRWLLGDIRDKCRVKRATKGIDYVFNCAAIKHVPICEFNPIEAVSVNIIGLENIIEACIKYKVKKLIHISTDKAVNPESVMGATKMIGERLCISRNQSKGLSSIVISCVRLGNVYGSRGSIVELVKKQIDKGFEITLTDPNMERFFISLNKAGKFILDSLTQAYGGEIFIPKMKSIKIIDLIKDVIINEGGFPADFNINIIGNRGGEKLKENLLSESELNHCLDLQNMYIIKSFTSFNKMGD